jgi:hypothetical protein
MNVHDLIYDVAEDDDVDNESIRWQQMFTFLFMILTKMTPLTRKGDVGDEY